MTDPIIEKMPTTPIAAAGWILRHYGPVTLFSCVLLFFMWDMQKYQRGMIESIVGVTTKATEAIEHNTLALEKMLEKQ